MKITDAAVRHWNVVATAGVAAAATSTSISRAGHNRLAITTITQLLAVIAVGNSSRGLVSKAVQT